jgi:hypothetical protein
MVALAAAATVNEMFGPTNFSLGIDPTKENVVFGATTPEKTVLI